MFNLTAQVLRSAWPNAAPAVIDGMVATWPKVQSRFGFTSRERCAYFWAQISWECGGGRELRENGRYSADAIMATFGVGRHSSSVTRPEAEKLAALARKDGGQALFNRVYGLGNPKKARELGNTEPNDGWDWRGWNALNTTGRAATEKVGRGIGVDIIANPSLADDPAIGLMAGAYEYVDLGAQRFADADDIVGQTRRINGGLNGLDGRKALLTKWRRIVADNWSDGPLTAPLPPVKPSRDPDADAPAAGDQGFISAADPFAPENMTEDEIKGLKAKLVALGYVEVGAIDENWGSRTTASVAALQHDAGLPVTGRYDAATRDAVARGYQRPIADARANATVDDLRRAGSTTVQAADQGITLGQVVTGLGVAGGGAQVAQGSGVLDQINQVSQAASQVTSLQYALQSLAPIGRWLFEHWWVGAIGLGAFLIWQNRKIIKIRLFDHKTGANTGR